MTKNRFKTKSIKDVDVNLRNKIVLELTQKLKLQSTEISRLVEHNEIYIDYMDDKIINMTIIEGGYQKYYLSVENGLATDISFLDDFEETVKTNRYSEKGNLIRVDFRDIGDVDFFVKSIYYTEDGILDKIVEYSELCVTIHYFNLWRDEVSTSTIKTVKYDVTDLQVNSHKYIGKIDDLNHILGYVEFNQDRKRDYLDILEYPFKQEFYRV